MSPKSVRRTLATAASLLVLASLTGCKPDDITFDIWNKSGGTLQKMKVTYPGGDLSFDAVPDSTDTATFRHFDGPGQLAVSYTTEDGQSYSYTGPQVAGSEKGEVKVSIEGSYASFDTQFEANQQQ